jgi:hypothetical protein
VFETAQVGVLKKLQERAQKIMGFAIPIFHGRGVFNKVFGLLPFRRAVNIVVGRPVFFFSLAFFFLVLLWSAALRRAVNIVIGRQMMMILMKIIIIESIII